DLASAAGRTPGDTIFVFEGIQSYSGITLLNDQQLIGEGVPLIGNGTTLVDAGARPTIGAVGVTGVALASDNTVRGLDIQGTRGMTGTGVGMLVVNNVSIASNGGRALDVDNGTLTLALDDLASTGSNVGGVRLANVGGTFAAGTTAVVHTGGIGINVANSGFGAGDAYAFGATTVSGPGGIELTGNGGTATFRFESLDVDATGGNGLVIDAGVLNIGGVDNAITAVNGIGLRIANTTAIGNGAGGPLTFRNINVTDGASGIVLANTGVNGFVISGDGSGAQNASGGTFANIAGDAISLTNTANVELNQIDVNTTGRHGLFGNVVENLTIADSTLDGTGNEDNEDALSFRSGGAAITGTLTLDNVDITGFEDSGLYVFNEAGTLAINVTGGSDFDDNDDLNGTQAIFVETEGIANASLLVDGSLFDDIESNAIRFEAGSTGENDVDILSNVSTNGGGPDDFPNGGGISLLVSNGATLTFDVQNNILGDMRGDAISIVGVDGGGSAEGRIDSNILNGNELAATALGDGIVIDGGNGVQSGNWTILIQNNTIGAANGVGDDGIQVLFRDTTGTLNLTIEDNTIANMGSEGIRGFGGTNSPTINARIVDNVFTNVPMMEQAIELLTDDTALACFNVTGNSDGGAGSPGEIVLDQANPSTLQITQASLAALSAANNGAVVNATGVITFDGVCIDPPLPANP
ncbi:MAG: hypothetical protein OEN20_06225, partial [Gammaproteobacteria bacterium]|nr:hypothetical protein [Gammaproteobacteria bacterium]